MDKDGVEDGDQGKNRRPHDHNRDYAGDSIHESVAALRRFAPDWSGERLKVVLDLHCPWIRGPHNECIYMVGSPSAANWESIQAFGRVLEQTRCGPLPYSCSDNLPFGQAWNTYDGPLKTCQRWAQGFSSVALAATLEFPYANVGAHTVTPEGARLFGRDLASALKSFLSTAS
jgi:hypothetical protein